MESNEQQPGSAAILERVKKLCLRDDLATTALAVLEVLSRKTCFTADDVWFLELIEERSIRNRILRLQQCDLDPMDDVALELLLKRRTYFTPRQHEALATLEAVYGVTTAQEEK